MLCTKNKIQENKKIGIHIFVSDGISASASCYEALGTSAWCVVLVTSAWPKVLGRNSGEKSSVPVFLLSQFYHFTYHYIIRYQHKNTKIRNRNLDLLFVGNTLEVWGMYKKVYRGLDYDIICLFDKETGKLVKSYVEVHDW